MPGFVRIADTAKVELLGHDTGSAQPFANVMHAIMLDADQTPTNVANMAAAIEDVVGLNLGVWTSSAQLDSVRVTGLSTATSPQATEPFPAGTFGTAAAATFPGVCALVKLITTVRSRSGRGRIFIGPIAANEALDSVGHISTSFQGVVNIYIGAIETALATLTPTSSLVVASRKLGTSTFVTSAQCEALSAYQRRRALR
jgi:hypothetical protein